MRVEPPTSTTSSILSGVTSGVRQGLLAGADGALEDVFAHLLETRAGELHQQVLGTGGVGRDERQIDLGFEQRGKLHLGLFSGFLEALQRHLVFRKIDALFLLELGDDPVHDALVDVVAAEVGVAVGGFHFDYAVAHFEDGDVEGAAAEVVNGDGFVRFLVETVSERGRGGLVDDALDVETGDLARVFGGLALSVVEVGRNGDDGFGDLLAEVGFRRFLQLGEDHGGDLRRRLLLALDFDARVAVLARGRPCRGPSSCSSVTSSERRPMNRLIEKMVFSGFVMAWRLATWPTRRSPDLVKATTEGVVRVPS